MKKAAVVGAGFAGLAAAYFLSEKFQVTLFDQKKIGGGASGVSSGLLHPYPGEKGRLSWESQKAMARAQELLQVAENALGKPVCHRGGILRLGPIHTPGLDVEVLGPDKFLIISGITVFTSLYLQGLWLACEKRGVILKIEKVESLQALEGYEVVVLAAGAGIRFFPEKEHLKINFVKGQVLTCALEEPLERSISSKIYTAVTQWPLQCHVGATYERDVVDEIPDREKAMELLNPSLPVLDCRAGIRVTNPAHYFPILQQVGDCRYVITALGSRGLLYHGLIASRLPC